MIDAIAALLSMFVFGLACGMMFRDRQRDKQQERARLAKLQTEWEWNHFTMAPDRTSGVKSLR